MPWGWGKREKESSGLAPTQSEADPEPAESPRLAAPLPSEVRFKVEGVYSIMGEGCVVGGLLEIGVIRPPSKLRVAPGPSSPSPVRIVEVISAVSKRQPQSEIGPGTRAGLTLRGMPGASTLPGSIARRWEIQKGDCLVSL
jgi:translation elongation factor EF-1alpha